PDPTPRLSLSRTRQPLAKPGNSVAKVHARSPVAGIIGGTSASSVSKGIATDKRMPRERTRPASKDRRRGNAEFKIPCWLETDLLALQKWLPAKVLTKLSYEASIGLKHKFVSRELSEEPFDPYWSEPT